MATKRRCIPSCRNHQRRKLDVENLLNATRISTSVNVLLRIRISGASPSRHPSVNGWNRGHLPSNNWGSVIRSADGSRKGQDEDYFHQHYEASIKASNPLRSKNSSYPPDATWASIQTHRPNSVTLVLYDRAKTVHTKTMLMWWVTSTNGHWPIMNLHRCTATRNRMLVDYIGQPRPEA